MTKEALAALLNGREYSSEITREEANQAKADGLIVLFGYSDDNIELRGVFNDEVGMNNGGEIYLHRGGILPKYESINCPDCAAQVEKDEKKCAVIECQWSENGYSWFIKPCGIPFAPFDIMEDGDKFCRGVVIAVADLPSLNPEPDYTSNAKLRIAYNGDYPGYPCAWIDDRPLTEERVFLLLALFGIKGGNEYGGLKKLLDLLGAKQISEEHEPWEGTVSLVANRRLTSDAEAGKTARP